uniref:Uncharacterized protein n=1 Tax=Astyanax mexicanus TaxID=7994 RepID=A0A3B1JNR5_ASTMX
MSYVYDEDQFCCSVCLEILRDPVTIPCGHSYCMECIKGYWRKTEHKTGYSCPQCRRGFNPRPVLARNTMLAELVNKLREAGVQEGPHPGPLRAVDMVECDICSGRRRKAVKSCIKCMASYCVEHLKQHNDRDRSKTHKLTEPTRQLQRRVCSQHNRLFELYCRTDQQFICSLCTTDGHSGHQMVAALDERVEKQQSVCLGRFRNLSCEKEQLHDNFSCSAVEDDSERICTKLIRSIERRHGELKELVRAEGRAALVQAEGLLERLEQQIEDHRRRESELEQLSQTEDHIHFLQVAAVHLLQTAEPEDLPCVDVHPYFSLMILRRALTELRERMNDVCQRERAKTTLLLTGHESQNNPDHPERFTSLAQVLGKEGLSGRSYWEVEWSGNGGITIGVAYKGIVRNSGGTDSKLGCNSKSWSLDLADGLCTFQHNKTKLEIPTPISPRIGVYLDHKTGTLAFYCVSPRGDTMTLLHRVQTTFSQPLYPGFWVGLGSTLKVCPIFNFTA